MLCDIYPRNLICVIAARRNATRVGSAANKYSRLSASNPRRTGAVRLSGRN
jgi:hypothetical protein